MRPLVSQRPAPATPVRRAPGRLSGALVGIGLLATGGALTVMEPGGDEEPPVAPAAAGRPPTATAPPAADPAPPSPPPLPAEHRVAPGETLWAIAERHGVDVEALRQANAIHDPARLLPGTVLTLHAADAEAGPPSHEAVTAALERVAVQYGWRPATVKAVAWVESRWDQTAVSPAGAIGVMQVRPATGEKMSRRLGRDLNLYDLDDNVTAGVAYLDLLYRRYRGDVRQTLAAYHQGPDSLRRDGVLPVSERYISQVLRRRDALGP